MNATSNQPAVRDALLHNPRRLIRRSVGRKVRRRHRDGSGVVVHCCRRCECALERGQAFFVAADGVLEPLQVVSVGFLERGPLLLVSVFEVGEALLESLGPFGTVCFELPQRPCELVEGVLVFGQLLVDGDELRLEGFQSFRAALHRLTSRPFRASCLGLARLGRRRRCAVGATEQDDERHRRDQREARKHCPQR